MTTPSPANRMDLAPLHITRTEDTPDVSLFGHGGISFIRGKSLPENAFDFYDPIITWMKQFVHHSGQPLHLELQYEYFNSASGRYIFELLNVLDHSRHKQSYKIFWVCHPEDELMIERGEELKLLTDIPFEIKLLSENA